MASGEQKSVLTVSPKFMHRSLPRANDKASNSGANSNAGVLATDKSSRGHNMNTLQISSHSTGIAQGSQTKGARKGCNSNIQRKREQHKRAKEAINCAKEFEEWIEEGLAVDFKDITTVPSNEDVDKALIKFGISSGDNKQMTTQANVNATMSGVNLLGAAFNAKKTTLASRTALASKLIAGSPAADAVHLAQWDKTSKNGVYACCKEFIRTFKCLINFSRINVSTFRAIDSEDTNYPFWLGIRVFANKYSNPKAHYPMMLKYLAERIYGKRATWSYIRKEVIFGYYDGTTKVAKLAPQLKAMAEETDVILDSMSKTIDQTISAFRNMAAVIRFTGKLNANQFNASRFAALQKVEKIFETVVDSAGKEFPTLFGNTLTGLITDELEKEREAKMNMEKDALEHADDNKE